MLMPQFTFARELPLAYSIDHFGDVIMTAATSNGGSSPKDTASVKSSSSRRKFSASVPTRAVNGNMKAPAHAGKFSEDNVNDNTPSRPRALSNSSGDPEIILENTTEHDFENGNPRKRGSTDTIDYPRRRATIAVSFITQIVDNTLKVNDPV